MKIGRRAFLGGMAAAPLAAPMAAKEIAAQPSIMGALGSGLNYVTGTYPEPAPYAWQAAGLSKQAWRLLEKSADEKQRQYNERLSYRVNGFDADLFAMRAMSPAAKAHIQRERDRTTMAEIESLRLRLFPQREDDE